jgi:hypothetical protein
VFAIVVHGVLCFPNEGGHESTKTNTREGLLSRVNITMYCSIVPAISYVAPGSIDRDGLSTCPHWVDLHQPDFCPG